MRGAGWAGPAARAAGVVFLAVMIGAPLVLMAVRHLGGLGLLLDPYFHRIILWTIGQALASALVAGLLALPTALALRHLPLRLQPLYRGFLLLPFVTPVICAALGLQALVGPRGLLPLAGEEAPAMLVAANVFYNLGLVVWFADAALSRIPPQLYGAARVLGTRPAALLLRLEWPLIRAAVAAGMVLTFLFAVASFGLALLLAGRGNATIEVEIYSLTAFELDLDGATALALVQVAICLVAVLAQARLDRRIPLGPARPARRAAGRHWPALAWAGLVAAAVGAPLAALAVESLETGTGPGLDFYRALVADEHFALAVANSLRFTLGTVACALLVGACLGIGFAGRRWGAALAYVPYAVSGTVLSVALLLAYPRWVASETLLVGAFTLLAYPFVARQLGLAWNALGRRPIEAARMLGATPWRAARRVALPLLTPALRQGAALAGASAMGEFAVNLFLGRPEWLTLPRLIFEKLGRPGARNLGQAQAACVILLLLVWGCLTLAGSRHADPRRRR